MDPVKRRAYQLVPSWSATGLWDCSFEDSGMHQRFDHFKKRFPFSVINPTCLQFVRGADDFARASGKK